MVVAETVAVFALALSAFAQFPAAPAGVKVLESRFGEGVTISCKQVDSFSANLHAIELTKSKSSLRDYARCKIVFGPCPPSAWYSRPRSRPGLCHQHCRSTTCPYLLLLMDSFSSSGSLKLAMILPTLRLSFGSTVDPARLPGTVSSRKTVLATRIQTQTQTILPSGAGTMRVSRSGLILAVKHQQSSQHVVP